MPVVLCFWGFSLASRQTKMALSWAHQGVMSLMMSLRNWDKGYQKVHSSMDGIKQFILHDHKTNRELCPHFNLLCFKCKRGKPGECIAKKTNTLVV